MLLPGGGYDVVSEAGSRGVDNSKSVCGPVCKGLRDTATFPMNFTSTAAVSVVQWGSCSAGTPSVGSTGRNGYW